MGNNAVELKEDPSFEILPFIGEDEYCSTSLNSSMWNSIRFGSKSSSSGTLSEPEETPEINLEDGIEIVPKHSFSDPLDCLTSVIHQDAQSPQSTEFSFSTEQHVSEATSENSQNPSILQEKTDYVVLSNITEPMIKNESHLLKVKFETLTRYQQIEKKTEMHVRGCLGTMDSSCLTKHGAIENTFNKCPERSMEQAEMQIYTGREKRPENPCSVLIQSLKVYRWLRHNKQLQNLIEGAKSSFHSFRNLLETEVNLMLGMKNSLRIIIIADVEESRAIREAFIQTFRGPLRVSRFSEIDVSTPLLPVGYSSALQAVQSKINNAKRQHRFDKSAVLLSTATFIVENVPQRWQMSTVICLEDPNLGLSLHNFSVTTPVPNEYITLAQSLTPKDYALKDHGLAVTLKDVLRYVIKTDHTDMQEFLSGVNHFVTLKTAASVLAGMYNKYVSVKP